MPPASQMAHPYPLSSPAPRVGETSARTGSADAIAPEPDPRGGRRSLAGRTTTVTFSSEEEYAQVKLTFEACGLRVGFRSLNEFFTETILMAVEELERQHNDGQPFTTDDIPRRRRRRSTT